MAENIRGTIQYVPKPREFVKNNKTTYYHSIKVNDTYYSVGTKEPPAVGTLVEFAAEKNARGYWDVTKAGLTVVQAQEPTQSVATAAVAAAKTSVMSKDDYWRRREDSDVAKDRRIELQSCRNSAIELVKLLLTPIQTKEGLEILMQVPAKAKRVEFIEKLVEEYTQKFVAENNNKNESNNVEEVAVTEPVQSVPDAVNPDDPVWDA